MAAYPCLMHSAALITSRPDVAPLDKHVAVAGGFTMLQVVLELGAGWADVVDHVLQA